MRTDALVPFFVALTAVGSPAAQSQRLAGTWEGFEHAEGRDKPVAIVFRPRGPTSFTGRLYFNGDSFGAFEDARIVGDSLTFREGSFRFQAHLLDGERVAVRLEVRPGKVHTFILQYTGADTTRTPAAGGSGRQAAPPAHDTVPLEVLRSRAQTPGTTSGVHPALRRGTLLLIGGGPGNARISSRFVQLAGGPAAHVVVIPTPAVASNDPGLLHELGDRAARMLGVAHVTVLHTFSRAEANSEKFIAPLRTATGVFVTGGEGSLVVHSYMGTRTETELVALLRRGGVLGGTSAGALVWGSRLLLFRVRPDDPTAIDRPEDLVTGDVRDTGFGLLQNVVVVPHFTQFDESASMRRELEAVPGILGIGIDEQTALEVHGTVATVLGEGAVTVFDTRSPRQPLVLRDGARIDLVTRRQPLH